MCNWDELYDAICAIILKVYIRKDYVRKNKQKGMQLHKLGHPFLLILSLKHF